jgi:hypothetical protein
MLNSVGGCDWIASSNAAWAQVYPLTGKGATKITFTIGPNFRQQPRTAVFSIAGQTFTINQAAGAGDYMRRLIRLLYYFYLGRLASEQEVAIQKGGGLQDIQLGEAFFNALEFNESGRFVAGLYVGLLNRNAEYSGWLFQRNAFATNIVTQADLVRNFINAQEYFLKFGDPTVREYVILLYRYILLREPSEAEINLQGNELVRTGNRVELARAFLRSNEFRNGTGPRLTAFLLYATLLQRDPSDAERTATEQALRNGTPLRVLIEAIMRGGEFQANFN